VPVYQYACTQCSEQLEARQSFTDDALTVCPACEGRLRKVLSAVGVVFKGSGFYRTDSRSAANGGGDGAPSSDGAKDPAQGSGTDAGKGSGSGKDSGSGKGSGSGKDSGKDGAKESGKDSGRGGRKSDASTSASSPSSDRGSTSGSSSRPLKDGSSSAGRSTVAS